MARTTKPTPTVSEYHVYNNKLTTLGGAPVVTRHDGAHVVRLTRHQAQYFIDQGVIGSQSEYESSVEAQSARKQFHK